MVKGASAIAKRKNISDLVIGLTIVSIGTSLPELVINIFASATGSSSIAVGNIFGSNVANVLLILGLSAIFQPLELKRSTVYSEIPFALIATLLVGFLANATWSYSKSTLIISCFDGIVLLFFFILFMLYIFRISRDDNSEITEEIMDNIPGIRRSVILIVIGMTGLYFGGNWVVEGAIKFAELFGLSEAFIGLTIVAVGTSLPELVTSVVAAVKRSPDIAVGNAVGSNIFNLLWVLGLSAVIKPLPFDVINNLDVLLMVFSLVLIIIAVVIARKYQIKRIFGVLFLISYVLYIVFLVYRG